MIQKNILDPVDINHYFFTNNICESSNRTLNHNYKGVCKTLFSFEGAIKKLILLYENKPKYKDYNFSSSRAIAHYINQNEINGITSEEFVNYGRIDKSDIHFQIISDLIVSI